jgi:hypothetical protein
MPRRNAEWGKVTRQQRERAKKREQQRDRDRKKKEREEAPTIIEFKTFTRWRNKRTGKLVPFSKRKGATKETVQAQVSSTGRIIRTTGYNTKEEVKRTVVPGLIDEKGAYSGLVGAALDRTNIMSPSSLRGARKILVKVSGTDPHGERGSFKFDIDTPTIKKRRKVIRSVLLGSILYEMRARRWRTWYRIDQVDWSKKHYVSKTSVKDKVPMRDMEIVIRVLK